MSSHHVECGQSTIALHAFSKKFLEKKLCEITTEPELPDFTYEVIRNRAKTVDVIWFNERRMPFRFYEVEHPTNITNSLDKFYEL